MPAIVVPDLFPCPSSSQVNSEERRLAMGEGLGPLEFRTIELDDRQFQTLAWQTLSEEQVASFRDWFRGPLVDGAAWFAAPESWPAPEGLVVKVRRFLGSPSFQYLGVGFWRLQMTCEVRGETLLPNDGATPAARIWFDEFEGTAGTLLTGHAQDLPLLGSVWLGQDFTEPRLRGDGFVTTGTNPITSPYASSSLTNFGGGVRLEWGWNFRWISDAGNEASASGGIRDSRINFADGAGTFIEVRLDYFARTMVVTIDESSATDEVELDLDELLDENSMLNVRIVVNEGAILVQIGNSNVLVATIVTDKTKQEVAGMGLFNGGDSVTHEKSSTDYLDLWGSIIGTL
jgi:hypothetical protein